MHLLLPQVSCKKSTFADVDFYMKPVITSVWYSNFFSHEMLGDCILIMNSFVKRNIMVTSILRPSFEKRWQATRSHEILMFVCI